jgi:hypothetical protein
VCVCIYVKFSQNKYVRSIITRRSENANFMRCSAFHIDKVNQGNVYNVVKTKAVPLLPCRHKEERNYCCYSFLTSAIDGGGWSASRPGRALAPGKETPVPIVQEAGWAPEPAWTQRIEEKYFASARDRTSIARLSSL